MALGKITTNLRTYGEIEKKSVKETVEETIEDSRQIVKERVTKHEECVRTPQ